MRIYTRTGDAGDTGVYGSLRVRKDDPRIEACGDVDELNSVLGIVRTNKPDSDLEVLLSRIQNELFKIGADIATPLAEENSVKRAKVRLSSEPAEYLESEIDRLDAELEPLSQFILPGGGILAAHLHHARTVCRRAERRVVELSAVEQINPEIIRYLNRLSDLLFTMARTANSRAGVPDIPWSQ